MKLLRKKIFNQSKNEWVLNSVIYADGMWMRMSGLIPYKGLDLQEGMFFPDCSSIHTFFMRFPIDCYFLNQMNKVVKIKKMIKPFQFAFGKVFESCHVLEVSSLRTNELNIEINDILEIKEQE